MLSATNLLIALQQGLECKIRGVKYVARNSQIMYFNERLRIWEPSRFMDEWGIPQLAEMASEEEAAAINQAISKLIQFNNQES